MSKPVKDSPAWENMLLTQGINCKGYGTVPKYVMRDDELPIVSKGIYAYFCAMSGSGDSTFPSLETIQAHLLIGDKAYYNNRQPLIDQGYITIEAREREGKGFKGNLFTLITNPKKFADREAKNNWQKETFNTIEHEGLKAAGYGSIPKAVMQDPRMDVTAKAVYAYFASYAGAGRSAIPTVAQIMRDLNVSKPTYQKAMRSLKELGYITVTQENWSSSDHKGFASNHFILKEFPVPESRSKKAETQEAEAKKARTQKAQAQEAQIRKAQAAEAQTAGAQKQEARIKTEETTNNSFLSKNNVLSKNINHSITTAATIGLIDGYDTQEEPDYEAIIKKNVQYSEFYELLDYLDIEKAKELVLLMITACEGFSDTVRIGGEPVPIDRVRKRFLSINIEHIKYVIQAVKEYEGTIRNPRAYNLTALYHAPETMVSHLDNLTKEDF